MRTGSPSTSRGATLIVALILLVALSTLGITGGVRSTFQERMAGNTHNRDLGFQAAEYALGAADAWIEANDGTLKDYVCPDEIPSDGIRCQHDTTSMHENAMSYWHDSTNLDCSSDAVTVGVSELSGKIYANPCYILERLPSATVDGSATCPTGGTDSCSFYRVTARGVGGTSTAVVILQTLYRFEP